MTSSSTATGSRCPAERTVTGKYNGSPYVLNVDHSLRYQECNYNFDFTQMLQHNSGYPATNSNYVYKFRILNGLAEYAPTTNPAYWEPYTQDECRGLIEAYGRWLMNKYFEDIT